MVGVFVLLFCVGVVFTQNMTTMMKSTMKSVKQRKPDMICGEGNYLVKDGFKFFCVECPPCPPGQELKVKCDPNKIQSTEMDIECLMCKKGFFKSSYNHSSCQPCQPCPQHFKMLTPCDDEKNAVCSRIECEDGFKFDWNIVGCVSESPVTSIPRISQSSTTLVTNTPSRQLKCICNYKIDIKTVIDKLNFIICSVAFCTSFCIFTFAFVCYLTLMMRKASLI